jgi:hypothetical protein
MIVYRSNFFRQAGNVFLPNVEPDSLGYLDAAVISKAHLPETNGLESFWRQIWRHNFDAL